MYHINVENSSFKFLRKKLVEIHVNYRSFETLAVEEIEKEGWTGQTSRMSPTLTTSESGLEADWKPDPSFLICIPATLLI